MRYIGIGIVWVGFAAFLVGMKHAGIEQNAIGMMSLLLFLVGTALSVGLIAKKD